ncbi:hypothetical protein JCM8208_005226 [Rhodotorula glutinis]
MLRLASSVVALVALSSLVAAQTAAEVDTEQQTLATVIPGSCSAVCGTWLTSLAACPGPTDDAGYSACVCDATFVTNFDACAGCLANDLATSDAANAATASTAPGDLSGYCASAGTVVSTTSSDLVSSTETSTSASTDLATSSSSIAPESAASTTSTGTRTYSVPIPTITTPTVTFSATTSTVSLSSGQSSLPTDNVVTVKLTAAGMPFPTQSKSGSAFVSGAQGAFERRSVVGALVALAAVAGAMMLA